LGWLDVTNFMTGQAAMLQSFAKGVKDAGFRHVVLLGMGGSSLGPEVLRQTFGRAQDCPELVVLDSTVPAWIKAVTETLNPVRTLFLVSSKSGTTTETLALFRYFQDVVQAAVGQENAGQNFVAITDPGTPLAGAGEEKGFRRIFLNPQDIGGRYSVLSYFGLVPAAISGIDIRKLIDRSELIREACASSVPARDNPGARLGAFMGALALGGRDKLTLITSPAASSFGLWVEQLIAESTGKEGKGVIPVAGEPLVAPDKYGDDRSFVYLRLQGDDNAEIDSAIEGINSSGQPLLVLEMRDKYDIGAEFYRWEFATAIAGSILGIHPFNQPDVQKAKDVTKGLLDEYSASGKLPDIETAESVSGLLSKAEKGKYLAVLAYLHQTDGTGAAFGELRRKVLERYGMATTLGYGPRYLHSTGQLHKGGPSKGLFLQLTAAHETDIPIPGMHYTFGTVADAQALGDLRALQSAGRDVALVRLHKGNGEDIQKIIEDLK
jgi:glucose-6-phosphate isomerase/transaldolase/glucose-6-phosphate isomerase